ncbi:RHS repeat domain-containing protein [Cysteiniphilum litorale]|uniref:RHS repeat domain-containing protein n=1 Tax=Cysteiniphilum litorale TaxID=2056700 RepID=UPI003F8846CF
MNTATAFQYDQNGNLGHDAQGNQYRYNAQGQLISFSNAKKKTLTLYYYNAEQELSGVQTTDKLEAFIYDQKRLSDIILNNKKIALLPQKQLLCIDNSHRCYYRLSEQKNTSNLWIKQNQSSVSVTNYMPYGYHRQFSTLQTSQAKLLQQIAYDGEYSEPNSQLIYLQARFYNPKIMRFMQRDTYPFLNHYKFANDNPINNLDPSGHFSISAGLSVAALGIGILAPGVGSEALYVLGGITNVIATSIPLWNGNISRIAADSSAMIGSLASTAALTSGSSKLIFGAEFVEHLAQGVAMPFISNANNKVSTRKALISAAASLPFAIFMAGSATYLTRNLETENKEQSILTRLLYPDALLEGHAQGENDAHISDYLSSFVFGALRGGSSEAVRLSYFSIMDKMGEHIEKPKTPLWQNMSMSAFAGGFQYAGMAATHVRINAFKNINDEISLPHLYYNAFNYGWSEQFTVAQLEIS